MADKKVDGVIEAVRYTPEGKLKLIRAYLRRGSIWSDRVLMTRDELIQQVQAGKHWFVGQRVPFMAGTFDTAHPVVVDGSQGQETIFTTQRQADRDNLEGAPIF